MKRSHINFVAVGVLAVLALFVGGAALTLAPTPAPVSETVASYTPTPKPTVEAVHVAVFGDSYAAGVGAGDKALGWAARLGWNQQWGITNVARGGTGYVSAHLGDPAKAKAACGMDVCPNYAGMIAEAAAAGPTVVIVSGGRNDTWVDEQTEDAAIRAFYTDLRAKLPTAKIIAFNPLWDNSEAPKSLPLIAASVKSAVESVGGQYLDAGQPLAGHPELLAADGKHPNGIGHLAIFEAKVGMLRSAGLAV